MIKNKGIFLIMLFYTYIFVSSGWTKDASPTFYNTFDVEQTNTRAIGLGGAFTGVNAPSEGSIWNPAVIAQTTNNFGGISFQQGSGFNSERKGVSSICMIGNNIAIGWQGIEDYKDENVEIKVSKIFFTTASKQYKSNLLGINFGYIYGMIGETEENQSNVDSLNGFSVDWGLFYNLSERMNIGVVFFNAPGFVYYSDYHKDVLPFSFQAGVSLRIPYTLLSFDYQKHYYRKPFPENKDFTYHFGMEVNVRNVSLRWGSFGNEIDFKDDDRSFGIGYIFKNWRMDFAYREVSSEKQYFMTIIFSLPKEKVQ